MTPYLTALTAAIDAIESAIAQIPDNDAHAERLDFLATAQEMLLQERCDTALEIGGAQ